MGREWAFSKVPMSSLGRGAGHFSRSQFGCAMTYEPPTFGVRDVIWGESTSQGCDNQRCLSE